MKRWLLLLLILVLPASSWAAIAEVAGRKATGSTSGGASATCTLAGSATAGNLVIVSGGIWNFPAVTSVSVSQTGGSGAVGAFTTILGATGVSFPGGSAAKAFVSYATVSATGTPTFTVSSDVSSGNYINITCDVFSGTAIALDVNGGEATFAASTTPSDSITTLTANALIVGALVVGASSAVTITEGAGYTAIAEDEAASIQPYGVQYRVAGAATAYNVNWTLGSAYTAAIVNAAFKEVTGGDVNPPTVPQNLVVSATGSDRLSLSWSPSTDDIQAVVTYRLERAPFSGSCGAYTEIAQPAVNSYLDTGLTASTTYCYRVRSTDGTNLSAYSSAATGTTLAVRSLTLYWDDNSPNAQNPTTETGFQIERCTGAACSNFALLATVGQNVTTYVDATSPNPIAGYRVTALPSGGGYSNIVYSQPVLAAILSTFPPSLSFAAAPGFSPVSQSIAISKNVGAPAMPWTVSDNASWLTVTPASGTDDGLVTVSVNTTGLTAGTYNATITVTATGATGSPASIPVTLTMSAQGSGSNGRIR